MKMGDSDAGKVSDEKKEEILWLALTPVERSALFAERYLQWKPKPCDGEYGEIIHGDHPGRMRCYKCGYEDTFDAFGHLEELPRFHESLDLLLPLAIAAFPRHEIWIYRDELHPGHTYYEMVGWTFNGPVTAISDNLPSTYMITLLRQAGWTVQNEHEDGQRLQTQSRDALTTHREGENP